MGAAETRVNIGDPQTRLNEYPIPLKAGLITSFSVNGTGSALELGQSRNNFAHLLPQRPVFLNCL